MSEPSPADPGLPPKLGWYDDPAVPGSDRWWSGYAWTEHTARSPRASMFGPGYQRAWRARPNRLAEVGRWCAVGALTCYMAVFVAGSFVQDAAGARALVGILVLQLLVSIAAIVLGILGIRRSPRWGGLPMSIYSIVVGAVGASGPTFLLVLSLGQLSA